MAPFAAMALLGKNAIWKIASFLHPGQPGSRTGALRYNLEERGVKKTA
jgi:hypothetical protein